jgi:ribosome-associated translation inhibitor RaiA
MRVSMRSPGLEPSVALRAHLERRVLFAVARFGDRVRSVQATLNDANGPRGGPDKVCRLQAELRGAAPVLVEDADGDAYVAIDRAAGRLGRSVARELARRRPRFRDPVFAME